MEEEKMEISEEEIMLQSDMESEEIEIVEEEE